MIMARIIYKEGLEGQNRLECIEGIEIELLNGQKALGNAWVPEVAYEIFRIIQMVEDGHDYD